MLWPLVLRSLEIRPEPIMLLKLPIIPSRISQFFSLFLSLFQYYLLLFFILFFLNNIVSMIIMSTLHVTSIMQENRVFVVQTFLQNLYCWFYFQNYAGILGSSLLEMGMRKLTALISTWWFIMLNNIDASPVLLWAIYIASYMAMRCIAVIYTIFGI